MRQIEVFGILLKAFMTTSRNRFSIKQSYSVITCSLLRIKGRDSVVGIATRYGLDGPGIESRWRRDFTQSSRPALGPTQPPVQWVAGLFPGGKAAGAWG
jgi:hypothetical protein